MYTRSSRMLVAALAVFFAVPWAVAADEPMPPQTLPIRTLINPSVVYKVQSPTERLELTVHTSRILTMDSKIAQAQVSNPDLLEVTPLSPNQLQISAKAPGITQISLWDDQKQLYTIDVSIVGDVRELTAILKATFPTDALKVVPVGSNAVMISGFVDQPTHIDRIVRIAEEYYPKVINNMTVGGCQQVLLHVKVMEVSRTKLRRLGFDFSKVTGANVVTSGPSGLLSNSFLGTATTVSGRSLTPSGSNAFSFGISSGSSAFLGVLNALREDNLLKIVSEPTLATISGRPANFNAGGEIPIPVPQSLGTISIEWKKYGAQVDFVPIVLGNGKIRLEVRPRISELDPAHSMTIQGTTVPGILSRDADTGVEMEAGQTLAIAGLVQKRTEAFNSGLPWISEVPYLGAAFRNVEEKTNEIELLILVTPELVEAMDACEAPTGGPGLDTTSPSDWQLFMKGHIEVPNCCPQCGEEIPNCACNGEPNGPPPDGMIGPGEPIPTPAPSSRTSSPHNRRGPSKATGTTAPASPSSPASPPGFIGPVGYDVVK